MAPSGPPPARQAAPAVTQGMISGRIVAPLRGAAEPWYNEPNDHRPGPSAARCRR